MFYRLIRTSIVVKTRRRKRLMPYILAFVFYICFGILNSYFSEIVMICHFKLSAFFDFKYDFFLITSSPVQKLPSWLSKKIIEEILLEERTIQHATSKKTCQLPRLELLNSVILDKLSQKISALNCENEGLPLLFNSTMFSSPRLLPVKRKIDVLQVYGITSCCMSKINGYVGGFSYENVHYGHECFTLSFDQATMVPSTWKFLVIECNFLPRTSTDNDTTRIIDAHSFIIQKIIKPTINYMLQPPNVLILGIDSTSRLNFHRVFPEVHEFLVKSLSAVEIKGYHKIGGNTFPNVGPLLIGLQPIYNGSQLDRDVHLGCEGPNLSYDSWPFIWKPFHDKGYSTFYAEDGVDVDTFYLWRGGFTKPPTDYFLRPLMSTALNLHGGQSNPLTYCYGPRTGYQVLLDYLETMVAQMEEIEKPYFAFTFTTPFTHKGLNGGRYIVNDILKTLKRFHKEGYLDNTVLFVLSDHGIRTGDLRKLYEFFLGDRLPFLYVALAESFRQKIPEAFENLKRNADNRLVTPFDVHETLVDLLPSSLFGNVKTNKYNGFGKSLFSLIPESRNCETAGIMKEFCSCNKILFPLSIENPSLIKSAEQAVNQINKLVVKHDVSSKCVVLKLMSNLTSVEAVIDSQSNSTKHYRIVFETLPGNAVYEALVSFNQSKRTIFELKSNSTILGNGNLIGSLKRVNLCRKDSWCTRNRVLKPFCYCNNQTKYSFG